MRLALALAGATSLTLGCRSNLEVARLGQGDGSVRLEPLIDAAPSSAGPDSGACRVQPCQSRFAACGNCLDDDGDGLMDALDPDCWGACDDSEVTWGHAMSCSNQSCYFDRDCGLGNDESCLARVPNGCDCHGCCEYGTRPTPLYLGTQNDEGLPTCAAAVAADEFACRPCELDDNCFNPCEIGEVCFGER